MEGVDRDLLRARNDRRRDLERGQRDLRASPDRGAVSRGRLAGGSPAASRSPRTTPQPVPYPSEKIVPPRLGDGILERRDAERLAGPAPGPCWGPGLAASPRACSRRSSRRSRRSRRQGPCRYCLRPSLRSSCVNLHWLGVTFRAAATAVAPTAQAGDRRPAARSPSPSAPGSRRCLRGRSSCRRRTGCRRRGHGS